MADKKKTIIIEGREVGLKNIIKALAEIGVRTKQGAVLQVDTTKATKGLKTATAELDQFGNKVVSSQAVASKSLERFGASNRATGKDMASLSKTSASALIIAYAEIAANVYAAAAAFNALKSGAQYDKLIQSQNQLTAATGVNYTFISKKLKEATGNALDFQRASQYANLASAAGLSAKQITKLAEAGTKASIALGRDLGDSIDRIFRGTVKGEPEILDELGIIIRLGDASEVYAKQLGIRADKLTSLQKTQAIYNATLKETEKFDGVSADPDSFTKLAGSIKDTALSLSAFISSGLSPLAKLLAENKGALVAVATVLGSNVLGKAIGAFGSDVSSATQRLALLTSQAAAAKAVLERNEFVSRSYAGIKQDIDDSKAGTRRVIGKDIFASLGDTSTASKAFQAVYSDLNNVNIAAKELPESFATAGKGVTSFANQALDSVKRLGTGATATFAGIKNVSREELTAAAGFTQSMLETQAANERKAASKILGNTKTAAAARSAAIGRAYALDAKAAEISAAIQSTAMNNTANLVAARFKFMSISVSTSFAYMSAQAAKAGVFISGALGWVGILVGAGLLLSEVAKSMGVLTDGSEKLDNVSSSLADSLSTLNVQLEIGSKGITSFADALAYAEGRSSSLDVISSQTQDLVKALGDVKPGGLSNLLDVGDSDLEERLAPYIEYISKIGKLEEFKKSLKNNGLKLGAINDTLADKDKLLAGIREFQPLLESAATKAEDINIAFKGVKENNSAIKAGMADYASSLLQIDSNLLKVYNAQVGSLEFLSTTSQALADIEKSYSEAILSNNATLDDRIGIIDRMGDAAIEAKRKLFIFMGATDGSQEQSQLATGKTSREILAEADAQREFETLGRSVGARGAAVLASAVTAGVDPAIIDSYRTTIELAATIPQYAQKAAAATLELSDITAEVTKTNIDNTKRLALMDSQATLNAAARASAVTTLTASLQGLGIASSTAGLSIQNNIGNIQDKLSKAIEQQSIKNANPTSSPLELQAASNAVSALILELNAAEVSYQKLNPLQEVFGNSLSNSTIRAAAYATALKKINDAKDRETNQLTRQKELLDFAGKSVDTYAEESILAKKLTTIEATNTGLSDEGILLLKIKGLQDQGLLSAEDYNSTITLRKGLLASIYTETLKSIKLEKDLAERSLSSNNAIADSKLVSDTNATIQYVVKFGEEAGRLFADKINKAAEDYSTIELKTQTDINNAKLAAGAFENKEAYNLAMEKAKFDSAAYGRAKALSVLDNKATKEQIRAQLDSTYKLESAIDKQIILAQALDSAIDSLFGANGKSLGSLADVGKSLFSEYSGSLFKDFKKDLSKELEGLDISGTLGKVLPDSFSSFFKEGAGKEMGKSIGGIVQGAVSGYEQNGATGALIQGAFTAIGAIWGPIGAAIGSAIGQLAAGTQYALKDAGLKLNASNGQLSSSMYSVSTKEGSFFSGTKTKRTDTALEDSAAQAYLRSFEAVNQSFSSALNKYAAYFQKDIRAYDAVKGIVFGETLSFKGLSLDEQQTKIQQFFQDYGDALVNYSVPGLNKMQQAGETLIDTLNRVTRVTMTADIAFKSIFNLGADAAKNLIGSRNKGARMDLARGVLGQVQDDLAFAYSFVQATNLDVDVKFPKKKGLFSGVFGIVIALVLAVVTAGIGAALVAGVAAATAATATVASVATAAFAAGGAVITGAVAAVGAGITAGLGAIGVGTGVAVGATAATTAAAAAAGTAAATVASTAVGAAVGSTLAATTVGAVATGFTSGVLAGITTTGIVSAATGVAAVAGTAGLSAAAGYLVGAAVISVASSALATGIIDGLIDADVGKGILFSQDQFKLALDGGNFAGVLKSVTDNMKKYSKATFTLTAQQYAFSLQDGLFEATNERVKLYKSKGGKANAAELKAKYEEQVNLLNEYSDLITYLALEASGIDVANTSGLEGLAAKALGQLRAQFFDKVISFFDGEDVKAKEEAFNKSISEYSQGTSSVLELISNGIDGAINGITASVYTIAGAINKQKTALIDGLDYTSDLMSELATDIKGSSVTGTKKSGWRNKKKTSYASNQSIVESIYGGFIKNLGLDPEDQKAAYEKLASMNAEDIASLGNLQGEIGEKTFLARFGSALAPEKYILDALKKALPAIKEKIEGVNATIATLDSVYARLETIIPSDGQLPSLSRFTDIFEEVMATAPNPEVVAEIIKIGDTIAEALKALFEAFQGFSVEDLVGYIDKASSNATSFTQLGAFVADEFIAGTRSGLKDTFKNAIVEDFQKNLLGPILSSLTPAISGAFAGTGITNLNIQLNEQEITAARDRLIGTSQILVALLDNPQLKDALDSVSSVLGNIGEIFGGTAEKVAEITKQFSASAKDIVASLQLDAYSFLVNNNEFSIAQFKARSKIKDLNLPGLDQSALNMPINAVIAKITDLISSGRVTEENIAGVTEALQNLADISKAARNELQKAVDETKSAFDSVASSISSITLSMIKARKPTNATELNNSGKALNKYLDTLVDSTRKARTAFNDAKLGGSVAEAASAAATLQTALVDEMNARIDAASTLAEFEKSLNKELYDTQKKSLEDLVDISKSLSDFLKDIKFDDTLSILKPIDRLQAAADDFNTVKSRVLGGVDIASLSSDEAQTYIEDARRLLELGREVYASGDQYTALYNDVVSTISALQGQVDSKSLSLEAATAAYQEDDLALQSQIRDIQLATLSQLQSLGVYLAGNNALASDALTALRFNQDPSTISLESVIGGVIGNTSQISSLSGAINALMLPNTLGSSVGGLDTNYVSTILANLAGSVTNLDSLFSTVFGGTNAGIFSGQLESLYNSYTGFSSIGDMFPSFDTELATIVKELNTLQQIPTPNTNPQVNVTVAGGNSNEAVIARVGELLERLESVLGNLPSALRSAILQQTLSGARI